MLVVVTVEKGVAEDAVHCLDKICTRRSAGEDGEDFMMRD